MYQESENYEGSAKDDSSASFGAGLNGFQLKLIAIISMVIDHTGAIFFPKNMIWRQIGRLAFPIFCFLLVEGFFYTRDVKKYMLRLGIFAMISEIPYDLAFRGVVLEFTHQNVFFTLVIGVALMHAMECTNSIYVKIVDVFLAGWIAGMLCTDYSYKGIILISIYYFLKNRKTEAALLSAAWNFLWRVKVQFYGAFSSVLIYLYNGKRGRGMKYFFYVFYPLHLLILWFLKTKLLSI